MAIPNLAPGYLGQVKSIRSQREENERNRAFEADQASKNFLRGLGRDVLGAALGVGADLAGTKFRDYLAAPERLSQQGVSTYDDADFGDQGAAIRKAAEARATAELRPQASFGEAAETGFGRRGIDTGAPSLGGAKADVLRSAAPSTPPTPKPSNPMITPGIEAQFERVLGAPVARGTVAPRGMEQEAPRRPLPAPQSAPMAQPRPAPLQGTREAPGGYVPPRMSVQGRDAAATDAGVREALPYMDPKARGLEQQASDVREDRRLRLELLRRQAEATAMQAMANADKLRGEGAAAGVQAQAKAEADRALAAWRYADAAAKGKPTVDRRGRTIYQPAQVATPYGSTEQGFGAEFGPPPARAQAPSGGGGRGGQGGAGAGEEPTGDVLTLVVQTRDRKGNPVGPSQPRRLQEGPALWRAVATSPVDYGMNATQAAQYKEAFRAFNAALPAARKGDAAALQEALKAQDAMRSSLMAGQAVYAPEVAATREGFGTSPKDVATEQIRNEVAALRQQMSEQDRSAGRTRRVGSTVQEVATLAEPSQVTADEVTALVMDSGVAIPGSRGRFVVDDGSELERNEFESAVRGLPPPADMDPSMMSAYRKVADSARVAREKRLADKEALRARRLEGIAMELEAEGEADPLTYLEQRAGVVLPASLKAKTRTPAASAPAPVRLQAPAQPAARPTIQATSPEDLANKIEAMQMTPAQKEALYNQEAALRGWE